MNIVNDESIASCSVSIVKYYLCDYNCVYILITGDLNLIGHNITPAALKNCALIIKYIKKTDEAIIDDAEDLHLVVPMNNLLEYSTNYSVTNRWSIVFF